MNIFAVSPDPLICAKYLDDRRLVKMVLETAQILSTARIVKGKSAPYKKTHEKHQAVLWAIKKYKHRVWLAYLLREYYMEYRMRFRKEHKAWTKMEKIVKRYLRHPLPSLSTFANCAAHADLGLSFKHLSDTHRAYRLYLKARWQHENKNGYKPRFTNRNPPIVSRIHFERL